MNQGVAVLALALSACAIDSTEPELGTVARPCGPWACTQNTATGPDGVVFNELDALALYPNRDGVKIDSFWLGTERLKVDVDRDRLVGIDRWGRRLSGPALHGAKMVLARNGIPSFEAHFFRDTNPPPFWGGDTSQFADSWNIQVQLIGASPKTRKSACGNNPPSPNVWVGSTTSAVIFEGDRYDEDLHVVSDSLGTAWFHIACAGGYPAKLHLLRHTYAGGFGRDGVQHWPTTLEQRQTYLRAITADYRGDGTAYTEPGVRLYYGDAGGIYPAVLSGTIEAIWKADGAACMSDTRLDPAVLLGWFPEKPRCPTTGDWTQHGYVITVIPP